MSNQRRILLEDHAAGPRGPGRKRKGERYSRMSSHDKRNKRSESGVLNRPAGLAKPAGQASSHSVHLRPLRASCTSQTFTKYPLTTRSLRFVSAVLFISLFAASPSLARRRRRTRLAGLIPPSTSLALHSKTAASASFENCLPAGCSPSSSAPSSHRWLNTCSH